MYVNARRESNSFWHSYVPSTWSSNSQADPRRRASGTRRSIVAPNALPLSRKRRPRFSGTRRRARAARRLQRRVMLTAPPPDEPQAPRQGPLQVPLATSPRPALHPPDGTGASRTEPPPPRNSGPRRRIGAQHLPKRPLQPCFRSSRGPLRCSSLPAASFAACFSGGLRCDRQPPDTTHGLARDSRGSGPSIRIPRPVASPSKGGYAFAAGIRIPSFEP
jgi:hypothetical protein